MAADKNWVIWLAGINHNTISSHSNYSKSESSGFWSFNELSPTKKPKARPETPPWRSATKPRPCPGLRPFWGLFRIFRIRQTCRARSWWRSTGRPPRPCHWWPPVKKTSYRQPSKNSTSLLPQQAGLTCFKLRKYHLILHFFDEQTVI